MHDNIGMVGWFPFALIALAVLVLMGSLAVLIDSIRRPASHFGALGRWPYAVLSGVFLLSSAVGFVWPNDAVNTGLGVGIPVVVVMLFVYLLRVVFPTAARREARTKLAEEFEYPVGEE